MAARAGRAEIGLLLAVMDAAYDRKSWHGTNLRGSIRGVTLAQASWRPAPNRHNIWELVVHAAYWKYIGLRRLTGGTRGSFELEGSNWFERPVTRTPAAWRADVALLERTHRALRAAVEKLPAKELSRTPPGSTVSNFALLSGVAAHDLYHAGQIQLLKRLAPRT
jgi:uncharacterized damage-inducible protein DinB